MKAIFFSDAHIDRNDSQKIRFVVKFIDEVCDDTDMVFILGDLFEFYHGYEGYIFPWYKIIADSLKALVEKGKTVYFIEGNHEFKMGAYFERYTGIISAHNITMDFEGKNTYISHGYEISKFHLTKFLKTPFVSGIMDILGPDITWSIASMARIFLSNKKKPHSIKAFDLFRQYALKKFNAGYDVIVLGHSHMIDKFEYHSGGRTKQYFNTGDIIRHRSYVAYDSETGFELKRYNT